MNEVKKGEEKEPISGYYLNSGMLYSRDPDKIFKKICQIQAAGGTIDLVFKGSLIDELNENIDDPNTDNGIKGIKNVISFGLLELYEGVKRGNKPEDLANFEQGIRRMTKIVDCLLTKYTKDFFLLFTPEHDYSTVIHSLNVMALAVFIYKHVQDNYPGDEFLKIGTIEEFALAGLLHDMGKVYMEDIVLKTEKLTDEDWARIRKHPEDGYEILVKAGVKSNKILNATLFHHTRLDGTGYPKLKEGDEVLPLTRLISILDSIEAMISKTRRHNADTERPSMRDVINKLFQESMQKQRVSLPVDFLQLVASALLTKDEQQS